MKRCQGNFFVMLCNFIARIWRMLFPKKFFYDMDGTVADFYKDPNFLVRMYDKGYYANLLPHQRMIDNLKERMQKYGKENVYILSACVDTPYCADEKLEWLARHIPEMKPENIILVPTGTNKASVVPGGIKKNCYLIDDYSVNIREWEKAGGTAIKAVNPYNCKSKETYDLKLHCEY